MTCNYLAIQIIEFNKVRILKNEFSEDSGSFALSSITGEQRTDRDGATLHLSRLELFYKGNNEYSVISAVVEYAANLLRIRLVYDKSSLSEPIVCEALAQQIGTDNKILDADDLSKLTQVSLVWIELILEKLFKLARVTRTGKFIADNCRVGNFYFRLVAPKDIEFLLC